MNVPSFDDPLIVSKVTGLPILIKNQFSREHCLNYNQLHGCPGSPPDVKHLSSLDPIVVFFNKRSTD